MINSVNPLVQTVNNSQPVIFTSDNVKTKSCKSCCDGWLVHQNNSGLFNIVKPGIYEIEFNADVAQPTTAGEITLDISQSNTLIPGGRMITTPTVVNAYFNISGQVLIRLVCRETSSISVINNSGAAINVQQANIIIKRLS